MMDQFNVWSLNVWKSLKNVDFVLEKKEDERPDYRYWYSEQPLNFRTANFNKYFPHWMFVWENSVASGTFTQMKLEKTDTVWADIRWMNWDRVVIKQDWTYIVQCTTQYMYTWSIDASKVCAIAIEYVIDWVSSTKSFAKRSASNPDMITDTEFVSLEKWNEIWILQTHTYSWSITWRAILSIVKLS